MKRFSKIVIAILMIHCYDVCNEYAITHIHLTKGNDYMTNAINKKLNDKSPAERKIEQLKTDALCAADVARIVADDMKIVLDPKRARAHLRKHVAAYQTIRKTTFARDSKPFKTLYDALTAFASKMKTPTNA